MESIPTPPGDPPAAVPRHDIPIRNHIIDIARASSVLMVVLFHSLLFRVQIVDGAPVVTPWEPPPTWWPLSWLVMIMPVFFVSAGFADAIAVDNMNARGTGLARYLTGRGHRLVGPLVLFVSFVATVSTIAAWGSGTVAATPYPGSAGVSWLDLATWLSRDYCYFLWFVAVYLFLVMAAPLLVRVQDRAGGVVIVVLGVASAAMDLWSFAADDPRLRLLNVVLVWTLCHQFGIAYQRGWFRRGPVRVPLLTLVGSVAAIVALITVVGYPPSAVAFSDPTVANNVPPTLALALLGLAQASVLGLLERVGTLRTLGPRPAARIAALNNVMVDVYLWQNTCIIIAMQSLVWFALVWPAVEPLALSPIGVMLGSAAVLWGFVPLVSRLERRLTPRLGDHQSLAAAVTAYLLLLSGTTLVWLHGAVLHPERPWSSAGVILVWAGALAMTRAANAVTVDRRTGSPPSEEDLTR